VAEEKVPVVMREIRLRDKELRAELAAVKAAKAQQIVDFGEGVIAKLNDELAKAKLELAATKARIAQDKDGIFAAIEAGEPAWGTKYMERVFDMYDWDKDMIDAEQ
jgi:hypothetical protein